VRFATHFAAAETRHPFPYFQSEVLTIDELGAWLKLSRSQVYSMTRERRQLAEHPIPILRLLCGIRFRRSDVEAWLNRVADSGRVRQ
jgi:predicted DNA-binding transcriptional regulator AlpA